MARPPTIPPALTRGPFSQSDAERAGLTRWHLKGKSWKHVGPGLFVYAGVAETAELKLELARRRMPHGAVFSGATAAWLHRLNATLAEPLEFTTSDGVWARSGLSVRRSQIGDEDSTLVRGFPATSISRTLRDLCSRASLTEAVVLIDAALHARRVRIDALRRYVDAHARTRGIAMLRRALAHAEPKSESPMESRTRMLFLLSGLPRPEAQVAIRDSAGTVIGRVDLYYREARLAIEYDGASHDGNLVEDNRRQNRLLEAGVRLLRFTASDIYHHPEETVARVRRMLG